MIDHVATAITLSVILPDRSATAREVGRWTSPECASGSTATYRSRRDQAEAIVDRIPILGRLFRDFVRIEFIDRCMLIAAQGLLALVPMLVVLASFFPHLIGDAIHSFAASTGVGSSGETLIESDVTTDQVRAQTGIAGLLITLFSASSFARAIQRMYERVWEQPHIGGVVGLRRCLGWLIGWLVTLQLAAGLRTLLLGADNLAAGTARLVFHMVALSLIWWATSWLLLFGRLGWRRLALGALLTGVLGVLYSRASTVVMPPYVQANADQFGTLGVILAISTWLIGFAGIMVASALVGRIVSEDPTVLRVVRTVWDLVEPTWARVRLRLRRRPADGTAAPRRAAPPRPR